MRTLYLDCGMGVAGDMLSAALISLLPERDAFVDKLNALGLSGVEYKLEPTEKCGIKGFLMHVHVHGEQEHSHDHEHGHHHGESKAYTHAHRTLSEVLKITDALPVADSVREDIQKIYTSIASAEGEVHGVPMGEVHFHEVGTMDAIADVTAVCLAVRELKIDKILSSPVHVGSGYVKCAHGILPVPAPATANLLRGIPIYGGGIKGELCTPTGAALLRFFVSEFGTMPTMKTEKIGYGMGQKDFETANCVRAFLGETESSADVVSELCCNLDDMTGEEIAFATEELLRIGALDVFTSSIMMKKGRPGILLTVLCRTQDESLMAESIFKYTSTIGIRKTLKERYTLDRSTKTVLIPEGEVRIKEVRGYGISRSKAEYEDLAAIARKRNVSLREARALAEESDGKSND